MLLLKLTNGARYCGSMNRNPVYVWKNGWSPAQPVVRQTMLERELGLTA